MLERLYSLAYITTLDRIQLNTDELKSKTNPPKVYLEYPVTILGGQDK